MNEQVTTILNLQATKTNKIQQLLLLGLTRRQVADLVTSGNYGFVQNVYKRMLDSGMFNAQIEPAREIDYTFSRNFGVEIEAYNCTRERLARELREAGINVAVEGYNHVDHADHWKLVTDGSLTGNNTFELVSPILHGEEGIKELECVCWVLDFCDVKVNDSCGFHVHMDAADFDINTWRNLAVTYQRLERVIDSFMPAGRRNNRYCKPISGISERKILQASSIADLRGAFQHDRYHKVNLEAYARHRTVEFRQHSGTISFTKMTNWVHFLGNMITFAKQGAVRTGCQLADIPFIDDSQKVFFKLRTKKLSR